MIWIRADANREIGAGHVMRCLSIAAALKKRGEQVCFLVSDENALPLLQARQQAYLVLHSDYSRPEGELEQLEQLLEKRHPDFFLADSYYMTAAYFRRVRKWVPVGYVDDGYGRGLPLDMIVNYNIFSDASFYEGCDIPGLLLGTQYVPVGEAFCGLNYQVREQVSRVMITTGGSDRYNLTGQILERALENPEIKGLEYCVISGAYNTHLPELEKLARGRENVKVYSNVSNMQDRMMECDIAVSAGGSTLYELSAVGVPFLCFSFVENQERIVAGFRSRGLTCYGENYLHRGQKMPEEIVNAIAVLKNDAGLRRSYSKRLRLVVDGHGADRIADGVMAGRNGR